VFHLGGDVSSNFSTKGVLVHFKIEVATKANGKFTGFQYVESFSEILFYQYNIILSA
jgi:hypothetical protein